MKRGELWIVNLEPSFGRELHKKRPALIISSNTINQNIHLIIIPASSQVPQMIGPEMVLIDKPEGAEKPSVLLSVFIRSIDRQRLIKKIGSLSKAKMEEVEEALKLVMDIDS